jgi:chromosome segregation ATPase
MVHNRTMTADERFDRLEQIIERLGQRIDSLDQRMDRLDRRMDRVDQSLATLTGYVRELKTEMLNRFQVIENRLEVLAVTITSNDAKLSGFTKGVMDFGVVSSQLTKNQARQNEDTQTLQARVARIEERLGITDTAA